METRADIQHKLTLINDSFRSIVSMMENLFDQIYELQRLPVGSWKESEDKRMPPRTEPTAPVPKKERKKKMVVIASPTGPEILNM
jgi:hypothetical protein